MSIEKNSGPGGEITVCPNENCRFQNPAGGALFCPLCGVMIDFNCTRCEDNPPYAKFCMYCGRDLCRGAGNEPEG